MALYVYPYEMAAHLIVSDEDAADFLQSQFSNDLRPFATGQCTYGLWLDVKGKIVADSWVLCEGEERFRVFSEQCDGQLIKDKLEHHIIADDVELEMGERVQALAVVGENLDNLVARSGEELIGFPGRRSRRQSYEFVFADAASRSAWVKEHGCEVVSKKWIQEERMKSGQWMFQCEVLPGDLPGEAGLVEDAVSLTKGCFLGQEVVARMHNVGRPQRGLFMLSGPGDPPDTPCPVSNQEGKLLGDLRTAIAAGDAWKGVAMLKSRFVASGMSLSLGERYAELGKPYAK